MEKNWYAVHTYSGYERKVQRNIEHRALSEGYGDILGQVVIPSENVTEIKEGKKRQVKKILMPGYIMIEMEPRPELFSLVQSINGVSGFVGASREPVPLSEEEVENILSIMEEKKETTRPTIKYRVGEQVRVIEGPFMNFIGTVEEIDAEKAKLKVSISIFGRPTSVELDALQVGSV
jgi:transcriptional antiterminator NusG